MIRDLLFVRDIDENFLNRLILFLILKSSSQRCPVKKGVAKKLKAREPTTLLKRDCSADVSFSKICEIFKITYFEEQL